VDETADRVIIRQGSSKGEIMANALLKEEAQKLIDRLPESATWEDLQYEIYFRQAVEAGLKDSREGRTVPLEEARRQFIS
jgi:predicted transcriptional regulator